MWILRVITASSLLYLTLALSTQKASTKPTNVASQESVVPVPLTDAFSPNPLRQLRELLLGNSLTEERGQQHDKFLEESGGVWKSKVFLLDSFLVSAVIPDLTSTLAQEEAKGHLESNWPEATVNILGKKSVATSKSGTEQYAKARKVFGQALSLKTLLRDSLEDIETEVKKAAIRWENVADRGETIVFCDEISAITYNVIIQAIFGGELSETEVIDIRSNTDAVAAGIFSLPVDNFVVRNIPFLNRYANSMKARKKLEGFVKAVTDRRRAALSKNDRPVGMLDALLLSDLAESEVVEFTVDNVITSIFAGFDTTASLLTNLAMILDGDDEALTALRKELSEFDARTISGTIDVFDSLPCFKSAVHESFRYRPVVGATLRQATADIRVGKVIIPKGSSIAWWQASGLRSPKLYSQPGKACPLRFLHASSESIDSREYPEPLPSMFGYGKHTCPGQFLSQLEM
jgi:cytochrome P450